MLNVPFNAVMALLAAGFWGMGDFSGGMGVKSARPGSNPIGAALRVVLISHLTSFTCLLLIEAGRRDRLPHGVALLAGLLAGVCGGLSLSAFYIALARGAMGTSAAISGLLAAAIPAAVSICQEGSPGWHRLIGFAIAGSAIWLIAAGESQHEQLSTTILAIAAGVGFGLYFVALKNAGPSGPVWAMASARVGSISTCLLVLLGFRLAGEGTGPVRVSGRMLLWIFSTALFDTSGNLLFVVATRAGRLDIAAVLASLYPASTILLAAATLGERPTRRQAAGMTVAAAAVVLITL